MKHHTTDAARWFAVDPGEVDEVKACHPGDDGKLPARGATVRMVLTPHLHHVVSVDVSPPRLRRASSVRSWISAAARRPDSMAPWIHACASDACSPAKWMRPSGATIES